MSASMNSRAKMHSFWEECCVNVDVSDMTLTKNCDVMSDKEIIEIMGLLPDVTGKSVIELGAGIGRYTGKLASKAKKVIAVDFVPTFLDKNKEVNGHLGNIEFICDDALNVDIPKKSIDVVFSNWLLMYLSDDEVETIFDRWMQWLQPGGFIFLRESCFGPVGNLVPTTNPTFYRSPSQYEEYMTSCQGQSETGRMKFKIVKNGHIQIYAEIRKNRDQLYWVLQKIPVE